MGVADQGGSDQVAARLGGGGLGPGRVRRVSQLVLVAVGGVLVRPVGQSGLNSAGSAQRLAVGDASGRRHGDGHGELLRDGQGRAQSAGFDGGPGGEGLAGDGDLHRLVAPLHREALQVRQGHGVVGVRQGIGRLADVVVIGHGEAHGQAQVAEGLGRVHLGLGQGDGGGRPGDGAGDGRHGDGGGKGPIVGQEVPVRRNGTLIVVGPALGIKGFPAVRPGNGQGGRAVLAEGDCHGPGQVRRGLQRREGAVGGGVCQQGMAGGLGRETGDGGLLNGEGLADSAGVVAVLGGGNGDGTHAGVGVVADVHGVVRRCHQSAVRYRVSGGNGRTGIGVAAGDGDHTVRQGLLGDGDGEGLGEGHIVVRALVRDGEGDGDGPLTGVLDGVRLLIGEGAVDGGIRRLGGAARRQGRLAVGVAIGVGGALDGALYAAPVHRQVGDGDGDGGGEITVRGRQRHGAGLGIFAEGQLAFLCVERDVLGQLGGVKSQVLHDLAVLIQQLCLVVGVNTHSRNGDHQGVGGEFHAIPQDANTGRLRRLLGQLDGLAGREGIQRRCDGVGPGLGIGPDGENAVHHGDARGILAVLVSDAPGEAIRRKVVIVRVQHRVGEGDGSGLPLQGDGHGGHRGRVQDDPLGLSGLARHFVGKSGAAGPQLAPPVRGVGHFGVGGEGHRGLTGFVALDVDGGVAGDGHGPAVRADGVIRGIGVGVDLHHAGVVLQRLRTDFIGTEAALLIHRDHDGRGHFLPVNGLGREPVDLDARFHHGDRNRKPLVQPIGHKVHRTVLGTVQGPLIEAAVAGLLDVHRVGNGGAAALQGGQEDARQEVAHVEGAHFRQLHEGAEPGLREEVHRDGVTGFHLGDGGGHAVLKVLVGQVDRLGLVAHGHHPELVGSGEAEGEVVESLVRNVGQLELNVVFLPLEGDVPCRDGKVQGIARVDLDGFFHGKGLQEGIGVLPGNGGGQAVLPGRVAPDVPVKAVAVASGRVTLLSNIGDVQGPAAAAHQGQAIRQFQRGVAVDDGVRVGVVGDQQLHMVHLLQPVGLAVDDQDAVLRDGEDAYPHLIGRAAGAAAADGEVVPAPATAGSADDVAVPVVVAGDRQVKLQGRGGVELKLRPELPDVLVCGVAGVNARFQDLIEGHFLGGQFTVHHGNAHGRHAQIVGIPAILVRTDGEAPAHGQEAVRRGGEALDTHGDHDAGLAVLVRESAAQVRFLGGGVRAVDPDLRALDGRRAFHVGVHGRDGQEGVLAILADVIDGHGGRGGSFVAGAIRHGERHGVRPGVGVGVGHFLPGPFGRFIAEVPGVGRDAHVIRGARAGEGEFHALGGPQGLGLDHGLGGFFVPGKGGQGQGLALCLLAEDVRRHHHEGGLALGGQRYGAGAPGIGDAGDVGPLIPLHLVDGEVPQQVRVTAVSPTEGGGEVASLALELRRHRGVVGLQGDGGDRLCGVVGGVGGPLGLVDTGVIDLGLDLACGLFLHRGHIRPGEVEGLVVERVVLVHLGVHRADVGPSVAAIQAVGELRLGETVVVGGSDPQQGVLDQDRIVLRPDAGDIRALRVLHIGGGEGRGGFALVAQGVHRGDIVVVGLAGHDALPIIEIADGGDVHGGELASAALAPVDPEGLEVSPVNIAELVPHQMDVAAGSGDLEVARCGGRGVVHGDVLGHGFALIAAGVVGHRLQGILPAGQALGVPLKVQPEGLRRRLFLGHKGLVVFSPLFGVGKHYLRDADVVRGVHVDIQDLRTAETGGGVISINTGLQAGDRRRRLVPLQGDVLGGAAHGSFAVSDLEVDLVAAFRQVAAIRSGQGPLATVAVVAHCLQDHGDPFAGIAQAVLQGDGDLGRVTPGGGEFRPHGDAPLLLHGVGALEFHNVAQFQHQGREFHRLGSLGGIPRGVLGLDGVGVGLAALEAPVHKLTGLGRARLAAIAIDHILRDGHVIRGGGPGQGDGRGGVFRPLDVRGGRGGLIVPLQGNDLGGALQVQALGVLRLEADLVAAHRPVTVDFALDVPVAGGGVFAGSQGNFLPGGLAGLVGHPVVHLGAPDGRREIAVLRCVDGKANPHVFALGVLVHRDGFGHRGRQRQRQGAGDGSDIIFREVAGRIPCINLKGIRTSLGQAGDGAACVRHKDALIPVPGDLVVLHAHVVRGRRPAQSHRGIGDGPHRQCSRHHRLHIIRCVDIRFRHISGPVVGLDVERGIRITHFERHVDAVVPRLVGLDGMRRHRRVALVDLEALNIRVRAAPLQGGGTVHNGERLVLDLRGGPVHLQVDPAGRIAVGAGEVQIVPAFLPAGQIQRQRKEPVGVGLHCGDRVTLAAAQRYLILAVHRSNAPQGIARLVGQDSPLAVGQEQDAVRIAE